MHDGSFLEITYRKFFKSIDQIIKHMKYQSHLLGLAFNNNKTKINFFGYYSKGLLKLIKVKIKNKNTR